jgi:hypothetical protein
MREASRLPAGRMISSIILLAAFGQTGCGVRGSAATRSPIDQAMHVQVRRAPPPHEARALGPLEGWDGSGCGAFGDRGTFQGALNRLRVNAAAIGADYVELVSLTEPHREPFCYDQTFIIRGFAYRLAPRPAVAPRASDTQSRPPGGSPASTACEPPCSPGYRCEQATCAPVCNPACVEGQQCRADRTCAAP